MTDGNVVGCTSCGAENPAGQKFCGNCGSALQAPCPACGVPNPPGQPFCGNCGASLLATCSACGATNPPHQRFCGSCGAALTAPAEIAPAREPTAIPVGSTPGVDAAVVIPPSSPPVEEERRLITALFCDLVGFTPLTESLDPEEVREIQTLYFNAMAQELHRFGGTVEKYAGDAVLALFGNPVAHEDDPERAVRCALAMQQAFQATVADMAKREHGKDVALRIGINTGRVIAGAWDVEGTLDYSATGDALNTAARLQTSADPGGIIVGPMTMHLARRAILFGPRQDLTLKGKAEPFPAYKVLGLREQIAERWETQERAPLVGRDAELAQLLAQWDRSKAGEASYATVVAEAGVGKSRLLAEAVERMTVVAGTVVVRGRCLSYGESMSLHLVADLLRSLCQLGETDDTERIRSHLDTTVQSLLAPHDEETRAAARDVLGTLLGLAPSESSVTHASPQVRRQTLVRSLQLLLSALSTYRPAVILLEDMHWSDGASLEMMEEVLRTLADRRAIVLSARRPGRELAWETWPHGETIVLETLAGQDAIALAQSVVGQDEIDDQLQREIMERTGGNPFFVEELLRSLKETGSLVERNGRVSLSPGAVDELPSTLTELVLARLDQLDKAARSTAQVGSVIGRSFAVPVLSRVTGQGPAALQDPLDSLERAALAFPRLNAAQEYVFKHATIRDVAYDSLLLRRRRALHAATARAIINLYPPDEQVDVIAYHFAQTREHGEAATWLERAGDRAASVFANAEAVEKYREARRRQDLVDAPIDARARVDEKMGHIFRVLVRFDEGLETLKSALDTYGLAGDLEGARRVAAEIGRLHRARGTSDDGVEIIKERLEAEATGPATSGLAALHVALARLLYNSGRYQEQLEAATQGSEMASLLGDRRVLAEAEMSRSVALYHLRRTEDALHAMEAAIPIAEEVEDFEVLAILLGNTAMIYRDAGDFERSRVFRERSAHLAERVGDPGWQAQALSNLGELVFCLGQWDQAQTMLERALEIIRPLGASWFTSHAQLFLAQLHAARGEFGTSESYLEEALKLAREGGMRALLIIPVAFQAEMEVLRGDPNRALEVLEEIMDLSSPDEEDANLTGVLPIAAWALLEAGQPVRAAELARLGVERSIEERATVEVMTNQRVLGAAAVALGDWDAAETNLKDSLSMSRQLLFPYAEGRVLYEYGRLRLQQGRGTEARRFLEDGLKIFVRLDARPYIERTRLALMRLAA